MKYCLKCSRAYSLEQTFCLDDGEPLALKDLYGLAGRIIAGKYQIGELAAVGGMSAVYHAQQLGVKRHVAFKILLPNLVLNHPRMLGRFEREAHLAGRLTHENIAVIHDAGQTSDQLAYIVMEWLDGELLETELQAPRYLSYQRIAYLLRQIGAALDAAHAAQVIHRDLKPANIMITLRPDGRDWIKVFDFGLAKVVTESIDMQISHALGTPLYASPEQFRPGEEISGQSDIYSLGVILYRMLTRCVPFEASNMHELIRLHLLEMPPPLTRLRPDVPKTIEQLVTRMLAKTPHYRPATAAEAAALFEQAVEHLSLAERQRELPAKPQLFAQTERTAGTHPITENPSRRGKKAANQNLGAKTRQAANFNRVRQTKQLVLPASPVATKKSASPSPAVKSTIPDRQKAKPAIREPARHMVTKTAHYDTKTLLLLGLTALLLAALAGYLIFHRRTELARQRFSLAQTEGSASSLADFNYDPRREQ